MLGNLWRQNIYLDSASLEKSSFPFLGFVGGGIAGPLWGGVGIQSQRAAVVLILGLASKHSHSRLARRSGCCCLSCQHTGADIFPIWSLSDVLVIFPLACFSSPPSSSPFSPPASSSFSSCYFLVVFGSLCFLFPSLKDLVSLFFTSFYQQMHLCVFFSIFHTSFHLSALLFSLYLN